VKGNLKNLRKPKKIKGNFKVKEAENKNQVKETF
jgi:hypothetical protein